MNGIAASVQVVLALPDEQSVVDVPFEPGLTAARAVELSGLPVGNPPIDRRSIVLGIFGEPVASDRVLCPGDRVEICRPLRTDPRNLRRMLYASGQVMGGSKSAVVK